MALTNVLGTGVVIILFVVLGNPSAQWLPNGAGLTP
jgi:hypothetical protein